MRNVFKGLVVGALGAAMLSGTTVLAGSGINAVFNLGVTNTVNALTKLTGVAAGTQELLVVNSSTASGSSAIRGNAASNNPAIFGVNSGISTGAGVMGQSSNGPGVRAQSSSNGPAETVTNTGTGPGVQITTNTAAPPLVVNSTKQVANLNAQYVGGYSADQLIGGLGSVGLAEGDPPVTGALTVAAGDHAENFVPVRVLTITAPGASSPFTPQMVYLRGHVEFYTGMASDKGCPCEFGAWIRDNTTNTVSDGQYQTFESTSTLGFARGFDVEAVFAELPGARTYQLEAGISNRANSASASSFEVSFHSSLSAATFPFGPSGTSSLSGGQKPAGDNQTPGDRPRH